MCVDVCELGVFTSMCALCRTQGNCNFADLGALNKYLINEMLELYYIHTQIYIYIRITLQFSQPENVCAHEAHSAGAPLTLRAHTQMCTAKSICMLCI